MSEPIPGIDTEVAPSGPGCAECTDTKGWWFHLRRCAECGHIGCCDSSPSQHASKHAESTQHQFIRSFEPGESWYYSYADEQMYDGPDLAAPQHHPLDQTTPGPKDLVPPNWQNYLN